MKRILCFAAAVIAAGLLDWLPDSRGDVGGLLPVQTLVLSLEDGRLLLEGGEDLRGTGRTWNEAMEDLCATAPGDAFFGTTGQIVLVEGTEALLPEVLGDDRLRPAARVYAGRGGVEPEGATAFLEAQKGGITLQALQAAALEGRNVPLEQLVCEDGRYRLHEG